MGCDGFWAQLNSVNQALRDMLKSGIGEDTNPFRQINSMRGQMLGKFMAKGELPRLNIRLKSQKGFSPGELSLWFDIEAGWFVEGRETPGSPPQIRLVDTETAIAILQETISPEEVHSLMTAPSDVDN